MVASVVAAMAKATEMDVITRVATSLYRKHHDFTVHRYASCTDNFLQFFTVAAMPRLPATV